jgi:hypothetical protein
LGPLILDFNQEESDDSAFSERPFHAGRHVRRFRESSWMLFAEGLLQEFLGASSPFQRGACRSGN